MPAADTPRRPARMRPEGGFFEALRNGLEVARKGRLVERRPAPFEVVSRGPHHRLRHYYPDAATDPEATRDPVLLVPPLMLSADLWDIAPESSSVSRLHTAGADPWVVDFGSPDQEEGGLERTLSDHVVAVSQAVDAVITATGRAVHLIGYSQGGMFAYQAAAFRACDGLASLVTFGSGVDLHGGLPDALPTEWVVDVLERAGELQETLIPDGIPAWATRLGFQLLDPIKTVQQRIEFLRNLSDREVLEQREGVRRFMESDGWTAFPGPALADLLRQLIAQNRLLQGGLVIDGRSVTLADLTCPILAFAGVTDAIAPPTTVLAIRAAAPRAESFSVSIDTGHFGLVVGSRSNEEAWPTVIEWLRWCRGDGPLPAHAKAIDDPEIGLAEESPIDSLRAMSSLTLDLAREVARGAARGLGLGLGRLGRVAETVVPQIGRIRRLTSLRSGTRVSPGLALLERTRAVPQDTFFLFEGRGHSYAAANERVDNIVRGLIHCGVRQGQHVGLLMQTRPSAVAMAVALSRLGAVTVLLRPDLPLEDQLALCPVDHFVSDPESGLRARSAYEADVLILGGGGEPRQLAEGLVDMESIVPERVPLPGWYVPNPGRAGELAFLLITGSPGALRLIRVTNRRWATSAYGTASACALTPQDTVYGRSPLHHPTGLLVCLGGALTGGARLAMASDFGAELDPRSFWHDVRRYGVNVVFYSGTLCRALLNAPIEPAERHHAIRLFAGSGMPPALWRRLRERWPGVHVVEFFASTEGNAVLANLSGRKVGALGRPLPGAADLAVAAWDPVTGRLETGREGLGRRAGPNQVGLLVERVDRARGELEGRPLRSLFEPGDAWLETRDLVRVDQDGDFWRVDDVRDLISRRGGRVATLEIEDRLAEALPSIDLVAVYALPPSELASHPEEGRIVAALTARAVDELEDQVLRRAVQNRLRPEQRPDVVVVLDQMPLTSGYRVDKRALREAGSAPLEDPTVPTFWMNADSVGNPPARPTSVESA